MTEADKIYIDREYTAADLAEAEKIMKGIMSSAEKKEFERLSADEKEFYLSGFLDNIKDYQDAAQKQEDENGGEGSGPQPNDPKKHLDKWINSGQQKPQNNDDSQNGRMGIPIEQNIEDAGQQTDNAESSLNDLKDAIEDLKDAIEDLKKSTESNAPEKANNLKDALKNVKRAAAAAANATTDISDISDDLIKKMHKAVDDIRDLEANSKSKSGTSADSAADSSEADDNETDNADNMSGNTKSKISATSRAETKLDRARQRNNDLFDDSDEVNRQSNDVSRDVQKASTELNDICNGTIKSNNAKESVLNAEKTVEDAEQTANSVKEAIEKAKTIKKTAQDINDILKSFDGSETNDNGEWNDKSVFDEPILKHSNISEQPKKRVGRESEFNGPDMTEYVGDWITTEEARQYARDAGYEDYDESITPESYATAKFTHVQQEFEDTPGDSGPQGYGHSHTQIIDKVGKMFITPTVNWRSRVKKFFRERTKKDIVLTRLTHLTSLHARGEDIGRGAHLKTHESPVEKITGLTQVLFMVDTSGSMCRYAGDGKNIFIHIMTELIELEKKTYIKNSAYARFNGGIDKDQIIKWTYKNAPNEAKLKEYMGIPELGGGTDIISSIKEVLKYPDIYNVQKKPYTLLVIVTDGEDNYGEIKKIMSNDMLKNAIIMITQDTDENVDKYVKKAISGGFDEKTVIGINYKAEWGEDITKNRELDKQLGRR